MHTEFHRSGSGTYGTSPLPTLSPFQPFSPSTVLLARKGRVLCLTPEAELCIIHNETIGYHVETMCCSPVNDCLSRTKPDPGSRASGAPRDGTRQAGIPGTDPAGAPGAPNKPNWPVPWRAREIRNPKLEILNKSETPMIETRQTQNKADLGARRAIANRGFVAARARYVKRTQFRGFQG